MNLLLLTFAKIKDYFANNALGWGITALKIVAVAFFGYLAIYFTLKILNKVMNKSKISKIAINFILAIAKTLLYIFLLFAILSILNVNITGFVAVVSAVGLAVALSLQSSFSNLVNGIIIISTKPFDVGDYIDVDGVEGSVEKITLFSTYVVTTDNKIVIIPNGKVIASSLVNYNGYKKRKVIITFNVGISANVEAVKEIVNNIFKSNGKIYLELAPSCNLYAFENGNQTFKCACWCDSEDYFDVYYYIIENLFNELKKNKIDISTNKIDMLDAKELKSLPYDEESLPTRVEKERSSSDDHLQLAEKIGKKIKCMKKKKNKK